MKGFRRQPPAYSPLPPAALLSGAAASTRLGADPRHTLAASLCHTYRAQVAWLLGSGTQALQLALELGRAALGERAPIVALPAFSCFDLASAAVGAAARVTFYDVDPTTLGPDAGSLGRALRDGARIVVVSPLYGVPVSWDEVAALAAERGALLIEDAAQGAGASWHAEPLGSLGALSVLSFGRGKGWTGGGAGGALLFRDRPRPSGPTDPSLLAELGVLLRAVAQDVLGRPALYGLPSAIPLLGLGTTRYHPPRRPQAMTRCSAAMLLASHSAAELEAARRRAMGDAMRIFAEAAGTPGMVALPAGGRAGYLRFPWRRTGGLAALPSPERALRLGVAPSYPTPLTHLAPLRPFVLRSDNPCPGARDLASHLLTLPTHSLLAPQELGDCFALLGHEAPTTAPAYTGAGGRAHREGPGVVTSATAGPRSNLW